MAQLVERLPDTQNVAGSNPAWGSSLEKEELSLGVVALLRLVSMTEHCTHVDHLLGSVYLSRGMADRGGYSDPYVASSVGWAL